MNSLPALQELVAMEMMCSVRRRRNLKILAASQHPNRSPWCSCCPLATQWARSLETCKIYRSICNSCEPPCPLLAQHRGKKRVTDTPSLASSSVQHVQSRSLVKEYKKCPTTMWRLFKIPRFDDLSLHWDRLP